MLSGNVWCDIYRSGEDGFGGNTTGWGHSRHSRHSRHSWCQRDSETGKTGGTNTFTKGFIQNLMIEVAAEMKW